MSFSSSICSPHSLAFVLIIPLSLSASLHVALLISSAAAAAPPVAMKTAARETQIHIVLLTKYPWPWSRLFCECRAWMANFHEGYSRSSCASWNSRITKLNGGNLSSSAAQNNHAYDQDDGLPQNQSTPIVSSPLLRTSYSNELNVRWIRNAQSGGILHPHPLLFKPPRWTVS